MTQISCCLCTWLSCAIQFLIKFQQFLFLYFTSFAAEQLWGFVLGSSPAVRSQPSAGFGFGPAGTGRLLGQGLRDAKSQLMQNGEGS